MGEHRGQCAHLLDSKTLTTVSACAGESCGVMECTFAKLAMKRSAFVGSCCPMALSISCVEKRGRILW